MSNKIRFSIFVVISCLSVSTVLCSSATSYKYTSNGSDWTDMCSTGLSQSPIDISNITGTCDNSMTIDMVLHNTDVSTTVTLDLAGLSSTGVFSVLYAKDINGVLIGYDGTKFQIHTPAEHQLDGNSYDMEIQFFHTIKDEFATSLADNDPAVLPTAIVSLLFNVDTSTTVTTAPFFDKWLPSASGTFTLNPYSAFEGVFDTSEEYYSYQGSRTQPDCDEDVNWFIFSQTKSITQLQLSSIKKYITGDLTFANGNGNNRSTQSVNSRVIKLGNVTCEEQFIYFFSFFILYIFINYFIFKLL